MAEKRIKILQVLTMMGRGGSETMIMNYYRALDRTKYQFDFLVHRQERAAYDDEIEAMGGKIYRTCSIRPGHYLKYFRFLDQFFKDHAQEYVAVHAHIQENSGFSLYYAMKYGIKNRLCTSHAADGKIDYKYPFRLFANVYLNKSVSCRLACGDRAGKFLYRKYPFTIFPNAIKVNSFLYSSEVRERLRLSSSISKETLVIGHIGRFGIEKNHDFVVRIFKELHEMHPNSKLILLGDGVLKPKITKLVSSLGLDDSVSLEGIKSNVSEYLNAFDLLLFPSFREGLPVSVIEAQTAGLKCLLSDTIDKDVDVTGNVEFMSLNQSAKEWAKKLLSMLPYQRKNMHAFIENAGYDVDKNIEILLGLYTN